MGEAKRKHRRLADMVAADPWCIYCNGPATTTEHMPPKAMFDTFRPRGMEFPCCDACNQATKLVDQVASWTSYITMRDKDEASNEAFRRLLGGIARNAPELFKEWRIHSAKLEGELLRAGLTSAQHAIRTDGPLMSYFMETFGAKFGFAMHYEKTGKRVGPNGAAAVRWFSNKSLIDGDVPFPLLEQFWGPDTLRQGALEASKRFAYKWVTDGTVTGVFGAFGEAFAVLAIASTELPRLADIMSGFGSVVQPTDFQGRPPPCPIK